MLCKGMKNILVLLAMVTFLFPQIALSESAASFEVLEPTYSLVYGTDHIRENMLQATLYVSSDEIWFSGTSLEGGPWLIKTNAQGETLSQYQLSVDNDERISVRGLSQSSNGLLLGIIDNKTTLGRVGLLKPDGQISYTDLGEVKIYAFAPMQDGILVQGVLYDESNQTCAPQTIRIDQDGQVVFKRTGAFYDLGIDCGMLTSSVCCASNRSVFVLEARGSSESFHGSYELFCLDLLGQEKWNITLDSHFVVYDLSASDDSVSLFGFSGDWDENGLLANQQAMIQCFSQEGVCQWTQQYDTPAIYQRGAAGTGISVAIAMENGIWYICVFGTEGTIQKQVKMDAHDQYINRPYILSDNTIAILGMTEEHLVIWNIP